MRLNDFFCGAGGMGRGFRNAGFDIVGAWDWKQHIVDSYAAHLGGHVKLQDIKKLTGEEVPDAEVWAFGFPCQDLSRNGKMKGLTVKCTDCQIEFKRTDTQKNCPNCGSENYKAESRSGMFFEIMRLLGEVQERPEIIVAENVYDLRNYLPVLEEEYEKAGYKAYIQLFNSKFWNVPQNRERFFVVGVRKDIDREWFEFPKQGTEITKRLVDILEDEVDDKFFNLSENVMSLLSLHPEGLRVRQATKQGYDIARIGDAINVAHPNSKTRRGRVGKQIAQTLLTSPEQIVWLPDGRFRYITPREAARCQGFPDDFPQVVTDNHLYFQMGNAVTVNVAEAVANSIKEQFFL